MRCVIQRVRNASVSVDGEIISSIETGMLVLAGVEKGDDEQKIADAAKKIRELRIFGDEAGKMNRSVQDVAGGLLLVSQFTLAADTSGGNRPSFTNAAEPQEGRRLYDYLVAQARGMHLDVQTGEFAAAMQVHLVNDGPVTIPLTVR
jgi:D-aminoacyl-tRNA deacylase